MFLQTLNPLLGLFQNNLLSGLLGTVGEGPAGGVATGPASLGGPVGPADGIAQAQGVPPTPFDAPPPSPFSAPPPEEIPPEVDQETQQQDRAARKRGGVPFVGDALRAIFAGRDDPNVPPEVNDQARRQAFLMAGLGTLIARGNRELAGSRRGFDSRGNPLADLAEGALIGQQAAAEVRNRALDAMAAAERAERQQQVGELITRPEGVSREDVDSAIALATIQGDLESVDRLIQFKNTFPEPVPDTPTIFKEVQLADGTLAVFDAKTGSFFDAAGERMFQLPETVATPQKDQLQFQFGVNPIDGEPVAGVINLTRQTFIPIDGIIDPSDLKGREISKETFELGRNATNARNNFSIIARFLQRKLESGEENPLRGMRWNRERFERTGVLELIGLDRKGLDSDVQAFLNAQEAFIIQIANQLGGVKVVASEIGLDTFFRVFGFEEGDSPENILNTLNELEVGVRALELQAGASLSMFQDLLAEGVEFGGVEGGAAKAIRAQRDLEQLFFGGRR